MIPYLLFSPAHENYYPLCYSLLQDDTHYHPFTAATRLSDRESRPWVNMPAKANTSEKSRKTSP